MTAPDPATVVQDQVFPPGPPPGDAILVYQGADPVKNGFAPWRAWDLRGPLLRLCWDLLRFQQMPYGKMPSDRSTPIGLRDSINVILRNSDQTYQIAQRIAQKLGVDISDILAQ